MKGINVKFIFIFGLSYCFLLCSTPAKAQTQLDLEDFKKEVGPLLSSAVAQNTLVYGAPCSYEVESRRQDLQKRLLKSVSSINVHNFDFFGFKRDLVGISREIKDLPGPLCNAYHLLQCNSNGTCDCATGSTTGINMEFVREGESCAITQGSICASDDVLNQKSPMFDVPSTDYHCASGSECIVKRSGETCSQPTLQAEFKRIFEKDKNSINQAKLMEYILKKVNEGICVCSGNMSTISVLLLAVTTFLVGKCSYF